METITATTPRRFVRDTELAARYGVGRVTIWRWAKTGLLPPPVRVGPGATRWDLTAVEQRERQRGIVADSAA